VCGGNLCAHGADTNGQWAPATLRGQYCDGVNTGANACKAGPNVGCGNYTCDTPTACKISCSSDADCVSGNYCSGGSCVGRKGSGAPCSRSFECQSLACVAGACTGCWAYGGCASTTPVCGAGGVCIACSASAGLSCLADGHYDCNGFGGGQPGCGERAPSCGTDGVCRCSSTIEVCPEGTICFNGACKIAGTLPCVQASDCAYGTCTNGICPILPQGDWCTPLPDSNPCDPTGTTPPDVPACYPNVKGVAYCFVDTS
jgi:hypothetical protein